MSVFFFQFFLSLSPGARQVPFLKKILLHNPVLQNQTVEAWIIKGNCIIRGHTLELWYFKSNVAHTYCPCFFADYMDNSTEPPKKKQLRPWTQRTAHVMIKHLRQKKIMRSDYIYPTPLPKEVHCISQNIINAPCSACAYAECMPSLSALSLGLFSTSNRFGLCLRSECHATRAAIKGLTLREITRQKRGSTAVKNNSRGTCQMCAKAVALSKASSYLTKESSLNY